MGEIILRVPDHFGKETEKMLDTTMQGLFGCVLSCAYTNNTSALEHICSACTNMMEENMKRPKQENEML